MNPIEILQIGGKQGKKKKKRRSWNVYTLIIKSCCNLTREKIKNRRGKREKIKYLDSVTCYTWLSHDTHMNETRHTYAWVTSHVCMSHVTHMHESCHTCEWVMSHIWMSHPHLAQDSHHTHCSRTTPCAVWCVWCVSCVSCVWWVWCVWCVWHDSFVYAAAQTNHVCVTTHSSITHTSVAW